MRRVLLLSLLACNQHVFLPLPPAEGVTEILIAGDRASPRTWFVVDLRDPQPLVFDLSPEDRFEAWIVDVPVEELEVVAAASLDRGPPRQIFEATISEREWSEIERSIWSEHLSLRRICPPDRVAVGADCLDAIADIDAGAGFACGRWSSGRISCWGSNDAGAVGSDETGIAIASRALSVDGIQDAVELSAGDQQACARLGNGRVMCWGVDLQGRIAGNEAPIAGIPRLISGIQEATAISASLDHACAIAGGEVLCWGRNDWGQLGDGSTIDSATPVRAEEGRGAIEIATGGTHTCARFDGGSVRCWGSDLLGQLGIGIDAGAERLDAGRDHTCAVVAGGVSCWGYELSGGLGGGAPELSREAVSIDLGEATSCAVLRQGEVECWGSSRHFELGDTPFTLSVPVPAPAPTSLDAAVGSDFVCSLDVDREVWCWGANDRGQLGDGASLLAPQTVALSGDVQKITTGDEMTCALHVGGAIECWGHNDLGQLGSGRVSVLEPPQQLVLFQPAVDVDAGLAHACALLENGDVVCWGDNRGWQVTPGPPSFFETPQLVIGGAVDIAAGETHSCAILSSGDVACWGTSAAGAVGHGVAGAPTGIGIVETASGAIEVDAGGDQTCVRFASGRIDCWGVDRGQELLDPVARIAIGRDHGCAITGGSVYCWGANDLGQLGDGTTTSPMLPVRVSGIGNARALIAGTQHSCAVVEPGELWCWGRDLTTTSVGGLPLPRPSPMLHAGVPAVRNGDGARHLCVSTDLNQVECWGANPWGQVLFETATIRKAATRVMGTSPR